MKTHRHWRVLLLFTVVALIAACGGGGTEDTSIPITQGDQTPSTTAATGETGATDTTAGSDTTGGEAAGGSMTMLIYAADILPPHLRRRQSNLRKTTWSSASKQKTVINPQPSRRFLLNL